MVRRGSDGCCQYAHGAFFDSREMRPTRFEIFVLLVVLGLTAYVAIPEWQAHRARAMQATCMSNLRAIGVGLSGYLEANDSTWPSVDKLLTFSRRDKPWPTLPVVLEPYVDANDVFLCPADSREIEDDALRSKFGSNSTWYATEGLSYEWLGGDAYGGRRIGKENLTRLAGLGKGRADQDLLRDFESFHAGLGGSNTLFADFEARPGYSIAE